MRASQLCQHMESALKSSRWREAMGLGERVLNSLPHHLWAQCLLGQAYLAQGWENQAQACFRSILERDPECTAAHRGLAQLGSETGDGEKGLVSSSSSFDPCDRAEALWRLGSLQEAAAEARRALQMTPQNLRAVLLLADIAWQRDDLEEFAEWVHRAQRLDPSGVVARRMWGDQHPLLHVLRVDPLVPMEGEGAQNKYAPGSRTVGEECILPPDNPPWLLDSPLPRSPGRADQQADTSLQAAPHPNPSQDLAHQPQMQAGQDEELAEIELELKRIASSLPAQALRPGDPDLPSSEPQPHPHRRPVRGLGVPLALIVSNRTALEAKYGAGGASRIYRALTELADAMSDKGLMQALVLYLDDPQVLRPYGLAPADPKDPQALKLTLNCLEERLRDGRGGGQSGGTYLLLIGGDDIVPFYPLPDPSEDEDEWVLSDHPYACSGDDYLSIQRAVGRLPDGTSRDLGFLLRLITTATQAHRSLHRRNSFWRALGGWLSSNRRDDLSCNQPQGAVTSFGYTASIWRRAAREVFDSIGQTSLLRTSPPLTCEEMPSLGPIAPRFSYFNLHGLRDSAYWYGQRDPTYAADYPLFPVAIKPDNILVAPHPEAIVFSEACYGAHILNKHQMSSLALRFLATQALGVVGSTALAYGAIGLPLVGADLLAKSFWERVRDGYPLGEALRQAKQALAQDMLARQGYLDPEDRKTMLSFVLYGDPTLVVEAGSGNEALRPSSKGADECGAWSVERAVNPQSHSTNGGQPFASTLCRRRVLEAGLVSPELMAHVQHHLPSYLPSSLWKDVIVSAQALCGEKRCNGQCRLYQSVAKGCLPAQTKLVFTLQQKSFVPENSVHQQIVKVTVDGQGNLVKIAISR